MVEEKNTTTFDHLMNFMTAYVQHNQVDPKDLPTVLEKVKDVVFNLSDKTVASDVIAETGDEAETTQLRGRRPRKVVVADVNEEETGEAQDALPFLAVVGTEEVHEPAKRSPGRPKKEVSTDQVETDVTEQPGYKFAHISRIPFGGMDPEDAIKPDSIINLIDGVEQTFIKRALKVKYDMTPEEYRIHFRLRPDYPVVAPNYSAKRQKIMNNTLRKMGRNVAEEVEAPRRGRPPKAATAPKANEAKAVKRTRRSNKEAQVA